MSDIDPGTAKKLLQLGQEITIHRRRQGLTQQHLANLAGVSRQTIARLEAGQAVSATTLIQITAILELELHIT